MKIALIAHDGKKAAMVAFVMKRLEFFNRGDVNIVATGTTGSVITHAGIDKVERVNSGPMGGDAEIGAMVARGEIDGVIFFRDPRREHVKGEIVINSLKIGVDLKGKLSPIKHFLCGVDHSGILCPRF